MHVQFIQVQLPQVASTIRLSMASESFVTGDARICAVPQIVKPQEHTAIVY